MPRKFTKSGVTRGWDDSGNSIRWDSPTTVTPKIATGTLTSSTASTQDLLTLTLSTGQRLSGRVIVSGKKTASTYEMYTAELLVHSWNVSGTAYHEYVVVSEVGHTAFTVASNASGAILYIQIITDVSDGWKFFTAYEYYDITSL